MDTKIMRDVLIEHICNKMLTNTNIYFLSADFGSPALDKLRENFSDKFINVGIAEQNLVNIAAGLAMEGMVVYAYAIAPFLSMRAFEQIRTNLSIFSQIREINVNLIGVGAGLSYDVTGPTHHCLEDNCIMQVLPNLTIFSPSDYVTIEKFVDYSIHVKKPKYIRLDGKAQPRIYNDMHSIIIENGFFELREGKDIGIIATGYMTHKALKVAENLAKEGTSAGVIDVFLLKPIRENLLLKAIQKYKHVVTMEESFINKGSLDSIIMNILLKNKIHIPLTKIGFEDKYVFDVGNREHLHKMNKLDEESIMKKIKK